MDASVTEEMASEREARSPRGLLSASFGGLLLTQFLTAINDNMFRWLAIGLGKQKLLDAGAQEHIGIVLMAGTACFVLPYLVLAAPAGYLADRFSKRSVIVCCKAAEIVLALLGVAAMLTGNVILLLAVVALFGIQSALFSPSRLGSIPEILPAEKISAANGLMGLTTVVATVVGMALGNVLADKVRDNLASGVALSAAALVGCAVLGWFASLLINRLLPADSSLDFPWNPLPKMGRDLRELGASRPLLRVALGIMFFWSVGALAQLNIDQFAFESGATRQAQIVPLLLSLVAGLGVGSVLAGVWSGGRVELGILPLGAAGLVLNAVLLFFVPVDVIGATAAWTGYYTWTADAAVRLGRQCRPVRRAAGIVPPASQSARVARLGAGRQQPDHVYGHPADGGHVRGDAGPVARRTAAAHLPPDLLDQRTANGARVRLHRLADSASSASVSSCGWPARPSIGFGSPATTTCRSAAVRCWWPITSPGWTGR